MMHFGCASLLAVVTVTACSRHPDPLGSSTTIATGKVSDPTVAVDLHGTTYVAWAAQSPDSSWNVMLARASRGETFGPPVRVNTPAGGALSTKESPPQVAVGPAGEVYVAWSGEIPGYGHKDPDGAILLARSTDGGANFSPARAVIADARTPWRIDAYHAIAIGPDGSVNLSWLDLHAYRGYEEAVLAARARGDTAARSAGAEPQYALVWAARSVDAGKTFVLSMLDSTGCICCRTAITAGPDSAVHALWRHVFPGNVRDFITARAPVGARSFSAPTRVHDDHWVLNGCPDYGPNITVDAEQTVHAVWFTGADGRAGAYYASSFDGGTTFAEPLRLASAPGVPAEVKIASTASQTWVIWEDKRVTPMRLRFARAGDPEGVVIGEGSLPAIGAGGGVVAVAWQEEGAVISRRSN